MSLKSYTLSGTWTLIKEEDHPKEFFTNAIPDLKSYPIEVPHQYDQSKWKFDYAYSTAVSRYHGYVWYYRTIEAMPKLSDGERYRIEFDRVSYVCQVYLNGVFVGEHRHSEERFSFDVTDAIRHDGENLLAVRCFEPLFGGKVIDGIRLDHIPNGFWAGEITDESCIPVSVMDTAGGILEDVRLVVVPTVRIDDIFLLPNPETGAVDAKVTIINDTPSEAELSLELQCSRFRYGLPVATVLGSVCIPCGTSTVSLRTVIPNHKLWELNNPTLYIATLRTDRGEACTLRFGFKDFRVEKGFFFLNGKRIFLKCAHGTMSAETVISMKAMGFNAFRSLQQVMPQEVLDLCDELGILLIESPLTAWGMRLHEHTQQMLEESLGNMVRMHRNHVCLAAHYLFNELHDTTILRMGMDCLPMLRELAPNTLFLLASGRWDKLYDVGSISNPGSYKWECAWGEEGDADDLVHTYPTRFHASRNLGMGDLHPYVYVPMDSVARNWFRTVGEVGKPVFISECGIGSQTDPKRDYFHLLELGHDPESASVKERKQSWDALEAFLTHYDMTDVYPFAMDLCRDSDRKNGRERQIHFDLIRSNPKINGFSLTSWGVSNEGTLEGNNIIKESVAHALQEGWAPLRWALFTEERVLYANTPFTLEAVLCNEDFLAPGVYAAEAKIKGKNGIVWSKKFDAIYPEHGYGDLPPLAASVLNETVSLPEGAYTLHVQLHEGAFPYGGELHFDVLAPQKENLPTQITAWGLAEQTKNALSAHGVTVTEALSDAVGATVFVGNPKNVSDPAAWTRLLAMVEQGARAVFLNPEIWQTADGASILKKIAGDTAVCEPTIDWLYHFDTVHVKHPLFDHIHEEGMLDLECFTELYPRLILLNTKKADKTICASLQTSSMQYSLTIGEYRLGGGQIVLNGFRIEEALGKNPYADQMLLNFLSYYGK